MNNTNQVTRLIYTTLMALLIVGCGTRKSSQSSLPKDAVPVMGTDLKSHLIEQRNDWVALKANLKAEIQIGQKSFSSRVNLSAARGEGLRLSVVPFPLVEAARLWFTPEGITFVDLINGRYASESYDALSDRLGFSLVYEQIEALFIGRVFSTEGADQTAGIRRLKHTYQGTEHQLTGLVGQYAYRFTLTPEALVQALVISAQRSAEERFRASYSGHSLLDNKAIFPQQVDLELYKPHSNGTTLGKLSLQYTKLNLLDNADGLGLEPKIRPQYEAIDLGQIIQFINRN